MKFFTLPCSCRNRRVLFAVIIFAVVLAAVLRSFVFVEKQISNDEAGRTVSSKQESGVPPSQVDLRAAPAHLTVHNDEDASADGAEEHREMDDSGLAGSSPLPAPPTVGNPLPSLVPVGLDAVKMNEWMDRTLEGSALPSNYGGTLAAIFRDRSYDEMTRNFAVQHFDLYAGALERRGRFDPDSAEANDIRAALAEASRDSSTHIAGSAILGMERLSHIDPNIDRAALSSLAATYAANASINLQTRIAAVQLCGTMRVASSLPTLRAIISDSSANTVLRISAQRALASFSE